ncbi:MAG: methylated-DNA--[protein]-cysteine S-methyltransferase [Promethearchaeota archaeon]
MSTLNKTLKAIFFKHNLTDIYIIIIVHYEKQSIFLREIKFFDNINDLEKYCERNNIDFREFNKNNKKDLISKIASRVKNYLDGENINLFDDIIKFGIKIDLNGIFSTDFSREVIDIVINIPFGQIITYSDIAKKMNSKAYRAIGNILKKNPLPLIIPCHRVIKKNGKIGGYMGTNDENSWQIKFKKYLLRIEKNESVL